MSKYTTEVRYICERAAGLDQSVGYNDVESTIAAAIPKIFDFDFPIFDASYRNVLETKILKHYYTREIGFETVGLWKLKLNTALNEIMPFYNQLYESSLLKFNPLYDTDLMTTNAGQKDSTTAGEENRTTINSAEGTTANGETARNTGTTASSGTGTATGTEKDSRTAAETAAQHENSTDVKAYQDNDSKTGQTTNTSITAGNSSKTDSATKYDVYSDTPQGALDGVDDGDYLTNARKITDSATETGKTNGSDIQNGTAAETGSRDGSSTGAQSRNLDNNSTSVESGDRSTSSTNTDNRTEISTGESSREGSSSESSTSTGLETANNSSRFNSTESYVLHVVGKNGGASYSKLLREFRETFLNIDMEIIEQLSSLFMLLW